MVPDVDAVYIGFVPFPSQFHADQIKAINTCNKMGVKLMIGLQRRIDQNFQRVKHATIQNETRTLLLSGHLLQTKIVLDRTREREDSRQFIFSFRIREPASQKVLYLHLHQTVHIQRRRC